MAFGSKTSDMKMPAVVIKVKKKKPKGDDVEDLDALFGGKPAGDEEDEGNPFADEGMDDEEADESESEEADESALEDELSEFSDDELEQEVARRKNKGGKKSKSMPAMDDSEY